MSIKKFKQETAIYLTNTKHQPVWFGDADEERRRIKLLLTRHKKLWSVNQPGDEVLDVFESTIYGKQLVFWAVIHPEEGEPIDGHIVLETIVEIMSLVEKGAPTIKAPVQISLWRSHDYPITTQIPAKIFWERLLKDHGRVMSDVTQTSPGRAFWQHQVKQALSQGMTVYGLYLDDTVGMNMFTVNKKVKLTKLSQMAQFYGGEEDNTRLLIEK